MASERLCLGAIAGAHGVRGLVKLKSFTERAEDIVAYGPLSDEAGERRYALSLAGKAKGVLLARIEGVADRDAAQALKGVRLYVERAALPAIDEPETFYQADLIGLPVEDREGRPLGKVSAVHSFGGGEVLEVVAKGAKRGDSLLIPFTKAAVPLVDLEAGRLVAEPPEESEAEPPEENALEAEKPA